MSLGEWVFLAVVLGSISFGGVNAILWGRRLDRSRIPWELLELRADSLDVGDVLRFGLNLTATVKKVKHFENGSVGVMVKLNGQHRYMTTVVSARED